MQLLDHAVSACLVLQETDILVLLSMLLCLVCVSLRQIISVLWFFLNLPENLTFNCGN